MPPVTSRLRAVIALDDHQLTSRRGLPDLRIGLIFRGIVAGLGGRKVGEFDDNVAAARRTFDGGEGPAADEKTTAVLRKDGAVRRRIRLVAFLVVHIDARDPIGLGHSVYLTTRYCCCCCCCVVT